MNHTKGGWKTNDVGFAKCTSYRGKRTGGRAFVVDDKLGMIAECEGDTQEEAEANAQLIAQAPKMYEALKALQNIVSVIHHTNTPSEHVLHRRNLRLIISKALDKAEGK